MLRLVVLCLVLALPSLAVAQVVTDCEPSLAQARSIAEPWEDNILSLANGDVRLAVIDAIEPGAVPFHLMVLTPPYDELGARLCWVVSLDAQGFGFSALTLAGLLKDSDSAGRLVLTLQAARWNDSTGGPDPALLHIVIDPQTGEVSARLD